MKGFLFQITLLLLCFNIFFTDASKDTYPYFQQYVLGQITYKQNYYEINGESNYFTSILVFDSIASLQTSHKYGMDKDNGNIAATTGQGVGVVHSAYDEKGTLFYRNTSTKEFLMRAKAVPPFPAHIVKDNWIDIDWQIKNEFKKIDKFTVQKATGYIRGRTWTVWFAPDIPYPFGPHHLHGLPGVILEGGDDRFNFTAIKIDYPVAAPANIKIEKPEEDKVWTIREYVRLRDNFGVYSMLEYHKQGKKSRKIIDPASEKTILEKRKKGIETIYEWENSKTKRAIYNKDTLNATVDYEAARELKNMIPPGSPLKH